MGDPVTTAVVGSIITSMVVQPAATKLAEGLGFSDGQAALLGSIAGVAAGGYVGNAQMAQVNAAQDTANVGADLEAATQIPKSEPVGADVPTAGAEGGYGGYSPGKEAGRSAEGYLSRAQTVNQPTQTMQPDKTNVSSQLVNKGADPDAKPSFLSRVFTPEKTMDLAMAAMGGIGEYAMAKEDREYPEKVREKDARTWTEGRYGGYSASLEPPY